jgi:hypothetical protein
MCTSSGGIATGRGTVGAGAVGIVVRATGAPTEASELGFAA